MNQSRAPLIVAIVLLLLPVLYVGSYFAVVVPKGAKVLRNAKFVSGSPYRIGHYRVLDRYASGVYWPLEKIDRKVRPGAWEVPPERFFYLINQGSVGNNP